MDGPCTEKAVSACLKALSAVSPGIQPADADELLRQCVLAGEGDERPLRYLYQHTPEAYMDLFAATSDHFGDHLARKFSNDLQVWHNVATTITASYGRPGLEKRLVNSYLMKDGSVSQTGRGTVIPCSSSRMSEPRPAPRANRTYTGIYPRAIPLNWYRTLAPPLPVISW